MGTNFYVSEEAPCPHCGRHGDLRHIGKSSAGWCFSLRVYPEDGINTLDDWKKFWAGKVIEDEYGKTLTEEEMLENITERGEEGAVLCHSDIFYMKNRSQPGPRGLLRHNVAPVPPGNINHNLYGGCVGHGEGTWDYILGAFS